MPKTIDCNYCNITCCKVHYHYDVTCKMCRMARCCNCQIFNQQLDALMKGGDEKTRKYIYTLIRDFFAISNESLKIFYKINKTSITDEVDLTDFTWKLRLYHGTKYSEVEHLSKTMKFAYTIRKRRFVYLRK